MKKIIFCLLVYALLLANNFVESKTSNPKVYGDAFIAKCKSNEECILHNQCEDVNKMTRKMYLSNQERRFLRTKLCRFINREHHFCCKKKIEIKKPVSLPEVPVCGLYFSDRIYSQSEDAIIDQYPWTAMIMYSKPGNKNESHCGGSLITQRHVLTAVHCHSRIPKSWKLIKVRLGEWDRRTNPDSMEFINEIVWNEPYVDVQVQKVTVHPDYQIDSVNQFNDIAILELENDVKFTEFIKPICLPVDHKIREMNFTGHSVEVSGFQLSERNEISSPTKKVYYLNVIDQDRCQKHYASFKMSVTKSQICAGIEEKKEFCNPDSGGSLMKEGNFPNSIYAHYQLIGIESYAPESCATKENPGVYTRVSDYMDWIIKNIN